MYKNAFRIFPFCTKLLFAQTYNKQTSELVNRNIHVLDAYHYTYFKKCLRHEKYKLCKQLKKILLMLKDIILNILIHDAKNLLSAIFYEIIKQKTYFTILCFSTK